MRCGRGCSRMCRTGRRSAPAGGPITEVIETIAWKYRAGSQWRGLPAEFGSWKTAYSWSFHDLPRGPLWLRPHEPAGDTRHRLLEDQPPPVKVWAVAHGHRAIIGCPYKPSMINVVAAVFMTTPR